MGRTFSDLERSADNNVACQGCPSCPGDVDGDGFVGQADLAELLSDYGVTSGATRAEGDLTGDGAVDHADLAELLAHDGEVCP